MPRELRLKVVSPVFQSFHASPTFSGPEEIRMLGLASAPQESPDSEIVLVIMTMIAPHWFLYEARQHYLQ